jgi:Zn-dependent peptidase ImmA (M78 family)
MRTWDDDEIEAIARRFRRELGVDNVDFLHVPTLIYKLKRLLPGLSYVLVGDSDLPDPGGRWDARSKQLIFRRSVFEGANRPNPEPRARFTIVHELIHAYRGHEGIRNRSAAGSLEKTLSTKTRRVETVTDRLAAAVLAPFDRIEPNETAGSIARRFGLSKQAAEIRADEAARYYRRKNKTLRPIPDSVQKILDDLRNGKTR